MNKYESIGVKPYFVIPKNLLHVCYFIGIWPFAKTFLQMSLNVLFALWYFLLNFIIFDSNGLGFEHFVIFPNSFNKPGTEFCNSDNVIWQMFVINSITGQH